MSEYWYVRFRRFDNPIVVDYIYCYNKESRTAAIQARRNYLRIRPTDKRFAPRVPTPIFGISEHRHLAFQFESAAEASNTARAAKYQALMSSHDYIEVVQVHTDNQDSVTERVRDRVFLEGSPAMQVLAAEARDD